MFVGLNTEFQVKCEFQINNDFLKKINLAELGLSCSN